MKTEEKKEKKFKVGFALFLFFSAMLFLWQTDAPARAQEASSQLSAYASFFEQVKKGPEGKARFSRKGVFGCEGKRFTPVGLPGPTGAYVPVFAEATHSHAQLLSYKECVLDPVVTHIATSNLTKVVASYINMVNKSKVCRNGVCKTGLMVEDIDEYLLRLVDKPLTLKWYNSCKKIVDDGIADSVCGAMLKKAYNKYNDPYGALRCDEVSKEDLEKYRSGRYVPPETAYKIASNPSCFRVFAYFEAEETRKDIIRKAKEKERWEISLGKGFAPIKNKIKRKVLDANGNIKEEEQEAIVTPGSVISEHLNLVLGSGIRRLENADEIDEMIQSFFANLGNRIIDKNRKGLFGINKSSSGDMSYLSALVKQEEEVASKYKIGAGVGTLEEMIKNEKEYAKYREELAGYILNAIHDLRNYERACFEKKILPGARAAISAMTQEQVCAERRARESSSGAGSSGSNDDDECTAEVSLSDEILPGYLDIYERKEGSTVYHGSLIFEGINSGTNSFILSVSNIDGVGTTSTSSINKSGTWTQNLQSDDLPEGELEALASYPNSSEVKNGFYKETIADIPVLVLPEFRKKIKITAKGDYNIVNSVILEINRKYSLEHTAKEKLLTSTLISALKDIANSRFVLAELYKIAELIKSDPELALWQIDQISIKVDENGNPIVHRPADVRRAKEEAQNGSGAIPAFVKEVVQENWESSSGWCRKENWEEFKVN